MAPRSLISRFEPGYFGTAAVIPPTGFEWEEEMPIKQ